MIRDDPKVLCFNQYFDMPTPALVGKLLSVERIP